MQNCNIQNYIPVFYTAINYCLDQIPTLFVIKRRSLELLDISKNSRNLSVFFQRNFHSKFFAWTKANVAHVHYKVGTPAKCFINSNNFCRHQSLVVRRVCQSAQQQQRISKKVFRVLEFCAAPTKSFRNQPIWPSAQR